MLPRRHDETQWLAFAQHESSTLTVCDVGVSLGPVKCSVPVRVCVCVAGGDRGSEHQSVSKVEVGAVQ
jgi:hypothetical protein